MKVKYIRVSTIEQNTERQVDFSGKIYEDKCSGSIPFAERKEAKKLLSNESVTEVLVHSIDRLGRNTLDIMQTIQNFTNRGINVISEKEGLQTLIDGKENPVAKMMIGILGTLAEFELSRIKERQTEGIAKAKAKGIYAGRIAGAKEDTEVFLNKAKNIKIARELQRGTPIKRTALLCSCSAQLVRKVKAKLEEVQ